MSLRSGEIYVSWSVRHCLRLLAQASANQPGAAKSGDEIADTALAAWLKAEHATLWDFCAVQQQREAEMVKELSNGK